MFISDGLLVIPLFLILVMLAMMVRQRMNLVVLGLLLSFFGWAWDARVIRSVILSLRERDFTKTAILSGTRTVKLVLNEYMPFATPLNLLDVDQQHILGDWVGNDTGTPWIGQCECSHPGYDVELGDHLPGYVLRTLELGLDASGLSGLHVYRSLLALGQHQRVSGSQDAYPEGWSVVETQP